MRERFMTSLYPMCYRIFHTIVLVAIVVFGAADRFGIPQCKVWHILMAIWSVLLLAGINYANKFVKIISFLVLILSVAVLLPLIVAGDIVAFWSNYLSWVAASQGYYQDWCWGCELVQTVWITLGCYIIQILTDKKRILKEILAVSVLLCIILCMFFEIDMHRAGIIFGLVYLIIAYTERLRLIWNKKKIHDTRLYLLCLVPFLIIYILMLSKAPIRQEPYDWKAVKDIYYHVRERAIIWWEEISSNNREDFGFTTTGFSEDGELHDDVTETHRLMFTVEGSNSLVTCSYLRGKTFDTFIGREWLDTSEGKLQEYPQDVIETLYAVKRYDEEWWRDYLNPATIRIKYDRFNTGYLFAPGKTTEVRNVIYEKDGSDFLFERKKGYGTEYNLSFYQLNMEAEEFQKLLEACADLPEDEATLEKVIGMLPMELRTTYTLNDLKNYRQAMRTEYMREVSLSGEMQDYLQQVTKDCTTPMQRLKAIEKELAALQYDTHPGKIPNEVDSPEEYLDYFLLESKKGYCAHFATAFVLLARAEGFPARYVEGFCVPIEGDRVMEVESGDAHAWPEVYLEGFGWVAFEPTPGYGGLRYSGWAPDKKEESIKTDGEDSLGPYISNAPLEPEAEEEKVDPEEVERKTKERLQIIWKGMLILLLICLLCFGLQKLINRYRYKKLSVQDKFLVQFWKNIWILSRIGYKRSTFETLDELQERIRESAPELLTSKQGFVFMNKYQEYSYAGRQITAKMLEDCQKEGETLLEWIKDKNKWYYMVICLVLWVRNEL